MYEATPIENVLQGALARCYPTLHNINSLGILATVLANPLAMRGADGQPARVWVGAAIDVEAVQPHAIPEHIDRIRTGPLVESDADDQPNTRRYALNRDVRIHAVGCRLPRQLLRRDVQLSAVYTDSESPRVVALAHRPPACVVRDAAQTSNVPCGGCAFDDITVTWQPIPEGKPCIRTGAGSTRGRHIVRVRHGMRDGGQQEAAHPVLPLFPPATAARHPSSPAR